MISAGRARSISIVPPISGNDHSIYIVCIKLLIQASCSWVVDVWFGVCEHPVVRIAARPVYCVVLQRNCSVTSPGACLLECAPPFLSQHVARGLGQHTAANQYNVIRVAEASGCADAL